MAKIEDLVKRISDEKLRDEIAAEVRELKKHKQFGLVFEEHLPEMLRLPKVAIRIGNLVVQRDAPGNDVWRVIGIKGKNATCRQPINPGKYDEEKKTEFPLAELVLVVSFGEPIYPVLTPVDRIARGGPDKPWHILINADNYHALQLLLYAYERKVDVIYIDPPYNTGARDWKYNNDYVDESDTWRHSKWLSMIKKRLLLAKRLLKPRSGVLVVTIDEHEITHLPLLLREMFPELTLRHITAVTNPKGVTQGGFSRVEEYVLVCTAAGSVPIGRGDDYLSPEPEEGYENATGKRPRWKGLLRSGKEAARSDREDMFYPILVNPTRQAVCGVGEVLPLPMMPDFNAKIKGLTAVWPVRRDGSLGRWGVGPSTLRRLLEKGYVAVGNYDPHRNSFGISYLSRSVRDQLAAGLLEVVSYDEVKNLVDVRYVDLSQRKIKTVWHRTRHDAGAHGADLLKSILGEDKGFSYPKSLYAVEDTLAPFVRDKREALILDFFAGSGTTLHATVRLNAEDLGRGRRQCILVTNNEVEEKRAEESRDQGNYPGNTAYEQHGICESVTWPRCKYVIQGHRDDSTKLPGQYLNGREMKEGFGENMEYFRLDFVDPAQVERGDAFEGILPILWMMAGAIGERESRRGSMPWYLAKHSPFAVLIQETRFGEFQERLRERKEIRHVFLVTDSEDNFALMRHELGRKYHCMQLYKSYLDNFRINTVDRHASAKNAD
jgi:adenine-specific DNA-methyltransferase